MGEHRVPAWTYKSIFALATVAIVAVGAQASAPLQRAAVSVAAETPLNVNGGVPLFLEPPSDLPTLLDPQVPLGAADFDRANVLVGSHGIPATVLAAYRDAEDRIAASDPSCALPAALLAAIGRVESHHARGGYVDSTGRALSPIVGPRLDGGPGVATIHDTDGGRFDGDTVYDRAVGPMQFIPSTWARWGADANDDGINDPQNVFDASLAAGNYLCAGDRRMTDPMDLRQAILSYNHSERYLQIVLAWMNVYASGAAAIADARAIGSSGGGPSSPAAAKPAVQKKSAPAESSGSGSKPPAKRPSSTDDSSTDKPDTPSTPKPSPTSSAAAEVKKAAEAVAKPVCDTVETVIDPVTGAALKLSESVCLGAEQQAKLEDEGGTIENGTVKGVPLTNAVLKKLLDL